MLALQKRPQLGQHLLVRHRGLPFPDSSEGLENLRVRDRFDLEPPVEQFVDRRPRAGGLGIEQPLIAEAVGDTSPRFQQLLVQQKQPPRIGLS